MTSKEDILKAIKLLNTESKEIDATTYFISVPENLSENEAKKYVIDILEKE